MAEEKNDDKKFIGLIEMGYRNIHLIRDLAFFMDVNPQHQITGYYVEWCNKNEYPHHAPLNPASIWMIASMVILVTREKWMYLFSDKPISKLDESYGLSKAKIFSEKESANVRSWHKANIYLPVL